MKQCSKCGKSRSLLDFYPSRRHESKSWCTPCVKEDNLHRRRRGHPRMRANSLRQTMLSASRKRKHPKPEWSTEEILQIIVNGKCEVTGIPFDLCQHELTRKKTNPFAPSPDRKDASMGYTKENTQWVVWIFNNMRKNFDEKDIRKFLLALKEII